MAAKFLWLLLLITGLTGISTAFSLKEIIHRNKRSYQTGFRDSPNELKSFRGRAEALCRLQYGPFACRNIRYDPPYFRIEMDHNRKYYPKWQNPYFRQRWPSYKVVYDRYESSEESISEHDDKRHVNEEQKFSDYTGATSTSSSGNPTQSYSYSKSSIPSISPDDESFTANSYVSHRKLPNSEFLSDSIINSRATETTSNPEISPIILITPVGRQQKSPLFTQKRNIEENMLLTLENSRESGSTELSVKNKDMENTSKFFMDISMKRENTTSLFSGKRENEIDRQTFPKSVPIIPSTTPEIKEKSGYEYFLNKTSSLEENLNKPKGQNLRTESTVIQEFSSNINKEFEPQEKLISSGGIETKNYHDYEMLQKFGTSSTEVQDLSSDTVREVTPLDDKTSSSNDIQSTSQTAIELKSTASQNSSSLSVDKGNSLQTESSSSERIYSVSTQNLETESGTSLSSSTKTYDGTSSQSKLISSFETQSTTVKSLEIESTTENSIVPNKITSIPFIDKVIEDKRKETFLTESPSLKIHFTPEAITKDHIIEISSIRTARIVVTTLFLVIALTALTVLAVYIFRVRRREVEYDQLMLIR